MIDDDPEPEDEPEDSDLRHRVRELEQLLADLSERIELALVQVRML